MPKQQERNDVGQVRQRLQEHFLQFHTNVKTGCHSKDSLLLFEKQILAANNLLDAINNKKPLYPACSEYSRKQEDRATATFFLHKKETKAH
jgi:hypothetical protein